MLFSGAVRHTPKSEIPSMRLLRSVAVTASMFILFQKAALYGAVHENYLPRQIGFFVIVISIFTGSECRLPGQLEVCWIGIIADMREQVVVCDE